jgi:hypothetical protein
MVCMYACMLDSSIKKRPKIFTYKKWHFESLHCSFLFHVAVQFDMLVLPNTPAKGDQAQIETTGIT